MPDLYIIAGPNGAGKTTAAYTILPEVLMVKEFVNADEIARGLSPFNPEAVAFAAGKIMLQRIHYLTAAKESFSIETTLTTRSYLKTIGLARAAGYNVSLFYLWLNSTELAKERVKLRVLQGGHNIPDEVIERRYGKSLENLSKFMAAVDEWYIYDNSEGIYKLVGRFANQQQTLEDANVFAKIVDYDL